MFTQNCLIHYNNRNLQLRLIGLGRKIENKDWNNLICLKDKCSSCPPFELADMPKNTIDCGENEDLFIEVAALRDDSDFMQMFILDEYASILSEKNIPKGTFILCRKDSWYTYIGKVNIAAHKASVKELIGFFK